MLSDRVGVMIATAAFVLLGCSEPLRKETRPALATPDLATPLDLVTTPNSVGVILPPPLIPAVLRQCSRSTLGPAEGYWTVTTDSVMALEARLPSFIREQRYFPISAQELALYKRQYAGLVRDGKQTIYVNLFSGEHEYWRQRVVGACDGGFGFFGVEYDVESRAFIHFASNGVA